MNSFKWTEKFSVSQCGICISQCEIYIPHCGFYIPHCETEKIPLNLKELADKKEVSGGEFGKCCHKNK